MISRRPDWLRTTQTCCGRTRTSSGTKKPSNVFKDSLAVARDPSEAPAPKSRELPDIEGGVGEKHVDPRSLRSDANPVDDVPNVAREDLPILLNVAQPVRREDP